jgi:fatty acid desaturase
MSSLLQPDQEHKRKAPWLFAHSRLDSLLVGLAFLQLGVMVYGVVTLGSVPWWVSVGLGLLATFLACTNYQCVAHNFIHNPFFVSKRLNSAFSVFNALLIGIPQSLYRLHHLHHHKYNNDALDPKTGTTKDFTSTWRYSKRLGQEESLLTYSLFGFFRSDLGTLLVGVKRQRLTSLMVWELIALAAMVTVFGFLNPLGLVAFYLPVWLAGTVAAQAENYLEHYGAIPGNRMTDSVSSYGTLYNLIWFNNGYHQEHHYRPQEHWTQVPEVRKLLPPETERHVVSGAHWFNLFRKRAPKGPSGTLPQEHHRTEDKINTEVSRADRNESKGRSSRVA